MHSVDSCLLLLQGLLTNLLSLIQVAQTLDADRCQVFPLARVGGILPTGIDRNEVDNLYIFNVLQSISPDDSPKDLLHKTLTDFLSRRPFIAYNGERASLRVMIVDQFEELFNLYPENWREQQMDFFHQIQAAVNADRLLRIVIVMREDHLAQ